MRSCTDSELASERQEEITDTHESATADLERGVWLYWVALRYRLLEPDPANVLYARTEMAALVKDKEPAFLREILEHVADEFCDGANRNGLNIDRSSARLAGLRDGCRSFPTIDWRAGIWEVQGHA